MPISVYKLNTQGDSFREEESTEPIDYFAEKVRDESHFFGQDLLPNPSADFRFMLLYRKNPSKPKWKDFLKPIVSTGQDVLKENQSWLENFVLLVQSQSSKNLYAITGGLQAYFAIQDFIEEDFGVDVLSRLIKKEDKILKSVKEKTVMGGILGSTKFFRNNYNLFENDGFGKIYQELQANIDKQILSDKFGFTLEDLKRDAICVAKTSFRINKAVDLNQVLKIISGCEYVLANLIPILINNVRKLSRKKEGVLTSELDDKLMNQLWQRFNSPEFPIDFDLCHKDFEKYLTADLIVVRKNSSKQSFMDFEKLINIDDFFLNLKSLGQTLSSLEQLTELIGSLKIYSYSNDDEINPLTKGWLLQHLFGDVTLDDDKKYFLIDGYWYLVEKSFIKQLDESCKAFIDRNYYEGLDKTWPVDWDENTYNETYVGEGNTLVLDKVLPRNVEPCDVLKWDTDNVYFCHVKMGFRNTMRDLCSQVFLAANCVRNCSTNNQDYLREIYSTLSQKQTSSDPYFAKIAGQISSLSEQAFLDIFKGKNIVFVLAIADVNNPERLVKDHLPEFRSSIAKFSLEELVKNMRGIEVDFKFAQIQKSS